MEQEENQTTGALRFLQIRAKLYQLLILLRKTANQAENTYSKGVFSSAADDVVDIIQQLKQLEEKETDENSH